MKKIFTLALGVLLTSVLFAADHRPTVILNSSRNFEVVIDGRSFFTNGRTIQLESLQNGRHSIRVYEMQRSFRGRVQKRLVSQSQFRLRGEDLMIRIDHDGQIFTKESRNRSDRNNRFRGRDTDRDFDRDFRDEHGWRRE